MFTDWIIDKVFLHKYWEEIIGVDLEFVSFVSCSPMSKMPHHVVVTDHSSAGDILLYIQPGRIVSVPSVSETIIIYSVPTLTLWSLHDKHSRRFDSHVPALRQLQLPWHCHCQR